MGLVTSKNMLLNAYKYGYAVGAFNVENMEMIVAVVEAGIELKAPLILQTTPSTINYLGLENFYGMVNAVAKNAPIPIALHLDHSTSYEMVVKAVNSGYSSVMIDGSKLNLVNNINLTKKVIMFCQTKNIPVEAEIGMIGGKEDNIKNNNSIYSDINDVINFVNHTNVDSLAIAIGNIHGVYVKTPKLNIDLLKQIKQKVQLPLVLHGASGLSDLDIKACINNGINKVNFATELRQVFTYGIKQYLQKDPNVIDPKKYLQLGKEYVKKQVMKRIKVCGCDNKI